jgi:hypothetical protein
MVQILGHILLPLNRDMNASTTSSNSGVSGMLSSIANTAKNLTRKASNAGSALFKSNSPVPNSPTVTSGPGVNVSMKGGKRSKRTKRSKRSKSRKSRKNRKN